MKKNVLIVFMCLMSVSGLTAQDGERVRMPREGGKTGRGKAESNKSESNKVDSMQLRLKSAYMWKLSPHTGERIEAVRDSSRINFHQSTLTDGRDVSVSYLGNIGSPAQSRIFFNRPEKSNFEFLDVYSYWRKNPKDHLYLNTKIPYSRINYQTGGGGETKEERLTAELSTNVNKKINIGFDFDYLYARGYYTNLYNKQINYDFNGSYIGDNYKMHAFLANNNFKSSDNGGITDPEYILNPESDRLQALNFDGTSLSIPVRIEEPFWTRMRGRHFFVSNRYDLGDGMEQFMDTDSVMKWREKEGFVSPASAILTTHYQDQRRRVLSNNSTEMDKLYPLYTGVDGEVLTNPKYADPINDYMSYWSLKNTLALSMNEGFRPWMKFGLSAFVEYDARKYLSPLYREETGESGVGSGNAPGSGEKFSDDALFIGGILSSSKEKHLQYRAEFEKDILNSDLKIEGNIGTKFNLLNREFLAKANAYLKQISPNFFEERFSTKYWNWTTVLDNTRRVYIGGEIESASTQTKISGGVENIKNYIYYGSDKEVIPSTGTAVQPADKKILARGLIGQESDNIQVLALRLDQNLQAGIFHWDNQVVYQTSSKEEVLPLPKLSLYSNVYLLTKIAEVMTLQLGADVRLHTKYYAPGYEPLTGQFYNQRTTDETAQKIGGYPLTNIYANFHMKYARFFVMFYNVTEGMGNSNYFSAHRYPLNPRMLKFGLSWSFNN